jgi:hypothetical protein
LVHSSTVLAILSNNLLTTPKNLPAPPCYNHQANQSNRDLAPSTLEPPRPHHICRCWDWPIFLSLQIERWIFDDLVDFGRSKWNQCVLGNRFARGNTHRISQVDIYNRILRLCTLDWTNQWSKYYETLSESYSKCIPKARWKCILLHHTGRLRK